MQKVCRQREGCWVFCIAKKKHANEAKIAAVSVDNTFVVAIVINELPTKK